jgi:hypothetical protein
MYESPTGLRTRNAIAFAPPTPVFTRNPVTVPFTGEVNPAGRETPGFVVACWTVQPVPPLQLYPPNVGVRASNFTPIVTAAPLAAGASAAALNAIAAISKMFLAFALMPDLPTLNP